MSGGAFERVRRALGDRVTTVTDGHMDARCPAHEDRNRSLSVDTRGGAVYLRCHAGCSSAAITSALGLSMRDLYDAPREERTGARRIVAEYTYTDERGNALFKKVRYEPKDFRIQFRAGAEWVHSARDVAGKVRWVLYRLPALLDAIRAGAPIFVVEGEKDVHTLERLGYVATCNAHGAAKPDQRAKWDAREAQHLSGARDVIILPDNDAPGEAHARAIADSLRALTDAPRVRVLRLPNLPPHGDVSDWIANGGTADQLATLIAAAPEWTATESATDHARSSEPPQSDSAAASTPRLTLLRAADVPAERVSWLWHDWLPFGKLVNVDGVAGVGKSTLITDLIARATRGGPMPLGDDRFAPVSVLIAGVEDGWGDTIRPRLEAANADLTRVHFVTAKAGEQFTVPRDVLELMRSAAEVGATWLHIEAIMGVLSEDVSANSDHEVRRAMRTLADAAAEARMLVTFIRHPRKAGGLAVNAGGGSVAFSALARVGVFVGWHPDDSEKAEGERRRVVAVSKTNIGKYPASLAFDVISSPLGNGCGAIAWQGVAPVRADDLASPFPPTATRGAPREKPDPRAHERAWLREQLAHGRRVKLDDLKALAHAAGLQWHRVKRAATDEGVSHERVKDFPSYSVWYLPVVQSAQLEQLEHHSLPLKMGAPSAPTVPTGTGSSMMRAHLRDGTVLELPHDSPDLVDFRDLFVSVEPMNQRAA